MEDDPHARFLLESAGDAAKKLRPETVDIETDCNVAGTKDGATPQQLDDSYQARAQPRRPRRQSLTRAHLIIAPRLGGQPNTTSSALRAR